MPNHAPPCLVYHCVESVAVKHLSTLEVLISEYHAKRSNCVLWSLQVQATSTASSAFKLLRGDNADCSDPYSGDILTEDLAVHSSEEQLDEWMTVEANNVWMEAGTHKLMLCVLGGLGVNVDTITFEPVCIYTPGASSKMIILSSLRSWQVAIMSRVEVFTRTCSHRFDCSCDCCNMWGRGGHCVVALLVHRRGNASENQCPLPDIG